MKDIDKQIVYYHGYRITRITVATLKNRLICTRVGAAFIGYSCEIPFPEWLKEGMQVILVFENTLRQKLVSILKKLDDIN